MCWRDAAVLLSLMVFEDRFPIHKTSSRFQLGAGLSRSRNSSVCPSMRMARGVASGLARMRDLGCSVFVFRAVVDHRPSDAVVAMCQFYRMRRK